jgi:Zn-dependent M28 family amino/carboxypeptidase
MLELARRVAAHGPMRRTLVFAAFGAEEFGQLGSRAFLARGPIQRGAIVAMVDLDMIGRARSGTPMWFGVDSGSGLRQLLEQHARRLHLQPLLRATEPPRSDIDAFLGQQIPAVLFTTGLHAQYHRPGDVPELIECEPALRWLDCVEALVGDLANGERSKFAAGKNK